MDSFFDITYRIDFVGAPSTGNITRQQATNACLAARVWGAPTAVACTVVGNTLRYPQPPDDTTWRYDFAAVTTNPVGTDLFIVSKLFGDADNNLSVGSGDRGLMYANWGNCAP
ncbi:MAG: hypothetical protein V2A79_01390 [Planctomycetota bacterium]